MNQILKEEDPLTKSEEEVIGQHETTHVSSQRQQNPTSNLPAINLEVSQSLETTGITQGVSMEVEEENQVFSQQDDSAKEKTTIAKIESSQDEKFISNVDLENIKKLNFLIVPRVKSDKNLVFDLFCDVPVHLEHFLRDAGCGTDSAVHVRSCMYNSIKKVECVESICHGSIIEGKLSSNYQASRDFGYLSQILKSKGSQKLFELSKLVDQLQEQAQILPLQIAAQISLKEESFFEKRRAAGRAQKLEILQRLDPRNPSFYKSYEVDWENGGSLKLVGYGFLKGYCELMGLSIAEYKQRIVRSGFLENLNYCQKIRAMLGFFSRIPWNRKQPMTSISHPIDCLTFDGIYFSAELRVDTYYLSYYFDQQHSFSCSASDTMLLLTIITDRQTDNAIKIARARRSLLNGGDDKNKDDVESDLKYSQDSQQFLELYYNNIYGPNYSKRKQFRQCEYVSINQAKPPVINVNKYNIPLSH